MSVEKSSIAVCGRDRAATDNRCDLLNPCTTSRVNASAIAGFQTIVRASCGTSSHSCGFLSVTIQSSFHAWNNSDHRSYSSSAGRTALMALFERLGLLPQRHARAHPRDRGGSDPARQILTPRSTQRRSTSANSGLCHERSSVQPAWLASWAKPPIVYLCEFSV